MLCLGDPLASSDLYREQDSVVNGQELLTDILCHIGLAVLIIFSPVQLVILMTSVFQYC